MQLSKNNLFVRWAYLINANGIPDNTNLCALFWRWVGINTILLVLGLVASICVTQLIMDWWEFVSTVLILVVGIATGVGLIASIIVFGEYGTKVRREMDIASYNPDYEPNVPLLIQGLYSFKSKFCPIIRLRG